MRVFVSYRRGDVGGYAGRLSDELGRRLGARSVFQDVSAIGAGEDFTRAIDHALDDSDAVLAVIGPGWLSASTPEGAHRLDQPDDYVRLELARALQRNVSVVPVLVGRAALPVADDLPDDLRELARRQAVTLHDETWHDDVEGLVRSLRGKLVGPGRRSRTGLVASAAVAIVALAGAAWWWRTGASEDEESAGEIPPCAPTTGEGWNPIALGPDPSGGITVENGTVGFAVTGARVRARGPGSWQVVVETEMDNATAGERYHDLGDYDYLNVGRRSFDPTCFSSTPDLVDPGAVGDGRIGFEVRCEPVGYIALALDNGDILDVSDNPEPGPC